MDNYTPPRITRDELMIRIAVVISNRGTCDRAQVGAVITREGRIISTGYVGAPAGMPHCSEVGCQVGNHNGCRRTVHAEANAVAFAARHGIATDGATLYSTHSPCNECAKLLINAGITEVYFEHPYRDSSGRDLLAAAGVLVNQLPEPNYDS